MKNLIFSTKNSISPVFLRVFLGLVLFPHGAQKVFGWFGGYGFNGTMNFFTDSVGLPWIVGFLVIIIEFVGSLCLIFGFAVRFWTLAIIGDMIGIILTSHTDYFFMNWDGSQKGEGFEYHLLVIGMALSLLITGAGRFSIDARLQDKKLSSERTKPVLSTL